MYSNHRFMEAILKSNYVRLFLKNKFHFFPWEETIMSVIKWEKIKKKKSKICVPLESDVFFFIVQIEKKIDRYF